MNPAPLPQPAPFTCPHCGAGLEKLEGFCPRCGAGLDKSHASQLSLWTIIPLVLGLLVFGSMGACGGILTLEGLKDNQQGGESVVVGSVVLTFSVPSLLIGLVGFILCLRPLLRRR